MALTEPLDLLSTFEGWAPEFDLMARQEQSRHASGRTRTKDFGSPLWVASFISRLLTRDELDHWRAKLKAASIDQMEFKAWPLTRVWPILHPDGVAGDISAAAIDTIGINDKSIRISGLPGVSLSVGDYVELNGNLHQVMEGATTSAGLTTLFEIRPHLWPGTATGQPVIIERPSCLMTIRPGSVSTASNTTNGFGTVSFEAIESRG